MSGATSQSELIRKLSIAELRLANEMEKTQILEDLLKEKDKLIETLRASKDISIILLQHQISALEIQLKELMF